MVGERVTALTQGVTVTALFAEVPLYEAVTFAVVTAVTLLAVAVNVNVAEDCPAGTVTLAGTVRAALSDERLTTVPLGAGAVIVTVPVVVAPGPIFVALNAMLDTAKFRTVNGADCVEPPNVTTLTGPVVAPTGTVVWSVVPSKLMEATFAGTPLN